MYVYSDIIVEAPRMNDFRTILKMARIKLANSIWQSPSWEANSRVYNLRYFPFLWNLKTNYRVHKSPPLDSILSQVHPVHTLLSHLSKIHFSIIHKFKSRSPLPSGFPTKIQDFFSSPPHPDRFWAPPTLPSSEYRKSFSGSKAAVAWSWSLISM
jgi:hypothetical protein